MAYTERGHPTAGPRGAAPAPRSRMLGWVLVALMALGSVGVWLLSPVGWIYVASKLQNGSQPSMGPYLLIIVGLVVTTIVLAKVLSWLNRVHVRVTRAAIDERRQAPWMRSLRGDRAGPSNNGVLDVVMLISVATALVCGGVWFFGFAGSSLPQ